MIDFRKNIMSTPKELFEKYIIADTLIGDLKHTAIMLFTTDPETLHAEGEVTASDGVLGVSDHVNIDHIGDEVWHVASQASPKNDGVSIFLDEHRGVSFGK